MTDNWLQSAVEDVLLQGRALLSGLSGEEYGRKGSEPNAASLGAHYRHVLDHFFCLLEGLESGRIDYDRRRRDPGLETSLDLALAATENLREKFQNLPAAVLERDCTVTYSVGYGRREAQAVRSAVPREVMFCVGHAIHHFAIVKLLCSEMSVRLPHEFGVAPSTLKHLEAQMAQ